MQKQNIKKSRLTVLLDEELAHEFSVYCDSHSHKKSTLASKLISDFLTKEGKIAQSKLF